MALGRRGGAGREGWGRGCIISGGAPGSEEGPGRAWREEGEALRRREREGKWIEPGARTMPRGAKKGEHSGNPGLEVGRRWGLQGRGCTHRTESRGSWDPGSL